MGRFIFPLLAGALTLTACARTPETIAAPGQFNPGEPFPIHQIDRMPANDLATMLDPGRSVGYRQLAWPTEEVTVAFLGGNQQIREIIEATANEWITPQSRIRLSFRRPDGQFRTWRETNSTPAADIRISFYTDPRRGGYWSAIGTLARRAYPNAPTMNLGDIPSRLAGATVNSPGWRSTYSHTTILHEFGHALGLNHEHFHPDCQRDMRMEQAVATVAAQQGWHPDVARFNLDAAYYFAQVARGGVVGAPAISPRIDRDSVMLYSLDPSFLVSGRSSICLSQQQFATQLSPGDRSYFAAVYNR